MSQTMAQPAAPGGAAPAPAPDDTDQGDQSGQVLATIVDNGDGTYTVYQGDEPDGSDQDEGASEDDADIGAPSPADQGGQHADSIGAMLKIVMEIAREASSSQGAPGSSESQFQAGFGASKEPTPAGM